MVISLKRVIKPAIGIMLLLVLITILWIILANRTNKFVMGGYLYNIYKAEQEYSQHVFNPNHDFAQESERFQRPSKQPALKLKYTLQDFEVMPPQHPSVNMIFHSPVDVIQAYYAILKDASNMIDFCGGCGTIGMANIPYPYAYDLLTGEAKQEMSLDEYITSFAGVGHTTLLKLIPVYAPPDTPENINYHMVEIEIVTGPKCSDADENRPQPSYFAYYYGLVTTEFKSSEGWKIKSIDYIPEDFLCAPFHHWYWESTAVVEIIFGGWYGLVDEIEKVDREGPNITIYAKGKGNRYRFDAVRLTNGEDILLREYIRKNGRWQEVDYMVEEYKHLKFSIWRIRFLKKMRDEENKAQ